MGRALRGAIVLLGLMVGCEPTPTGGGNVVGGTGDDGMSCPTPPMHCEGWADVLAECAAKDRAAELENCGCGSLNASLLGPPCPALFVDWTTCVGGLTCEEFDVWLDPPADVDDYPCKMLDESIFAACEGIFGG